MGLFSSLKSLHDCFITNIVHLSLRVEPKRASCARLSGMACNGIKVDLKCCKSTFLHIFWEKTYKLITRSSLHFIRFPPNPTNSLHGKYKECPLTIFPLQNEQTNVPTCWAPRSRDSTTRAKSWGSKTEASGAFDSSRRCYAVLSLAVTVDK